MARQTRYSDSSLAPPEPERTPFAHSRQRDRFFESIHTHLDVDAVAYAIANDGRRLLGCDRLAVLESRPWGCRLLAVSGVEQIDRRGFVGQTLERLAQDVAAAREPLYYSGDSADLAPQTQQTLDEYVNQSHVRRLAVVPLFAASSDHGDDNREQRDPEMWGVLVAEDFRAAADEEKLWADVADIVPQVALAMGNALTHQRMPLMPLARRLQQLGRVVRRPRTILFACALLLLISAICIGRVDYSVAARGRLQPQQRRDVFAAAEGIVRKVLVAHGDEVRRDDVLIELGSMELDLEVSRVVGELRTAQQRLRTVRAQLFNSNATDDVAVREGQLAALQQQLLQQIAGLEAEREALRGQQAELTIRSPIDGQVLTWNAEQLLADRPVRRGQKLLTVADPSSPWTVELTVQDRDIGEVLQTQRQLRPDLEVTFLLATDSRQSYRGRIQQVAITSELNHARETEVPVTVAIAGDRPDAARSGAEVSAKIHCGRRTIAFLWFHQLANAVRQQFFF